MKRFDIQNWDIKVQHAEILNQGSWCSLFLILFSLKSSFKKYTSKTKFLQNFQNVLFQKINNVMIKRVTFDADSNGNNKK